MNFFFDNNLSPYMAHAIRELSKTFQDVEQVIHLTDRFARNAPDVEWIGDLSHNGAWYIISIDKFRKQRGAEREALKSAGHTVFVLDPQWSKQSFWLQSERLVKWWPRIVEFSRLASGGTYRIPWQFAPGVKLQQL